MILLVILMSLDVKASIPITQALYKTLLSIEIFLEFFTNMQRALQLIKEEAVTTEVDILLGLFKKTSGALKESSCPPF